MAQELSVKDAAALLKVPEKTLQRWVRQGVIPASRQQDTLTFDRGELEGWARHNRIGSGAATIHADEAEEDASLLRAVEAGGVHRGLVGTTPAELYAQVVERFPFSAQLGPTLRRTLESTLLEREALVTTAIGHGVALPHPRHPQDWGLGQPVVGVFFPEHAVDYGALDREPVFVLFVLLCATVRGHLKLLSRVSHLASRPELREFLRGQPGAADLLERIRHALPDPP